MYMIMALWLSVTGVSAEWYHACPQDLYGAFRLAESLYDEYCPQPGGVNVITQQSMALLNTDFSYRLEKEHADAEAAVFLHDTTGNANDMAEKLTEETREYLACAGALNEEIPQMCHRTARATASTGLGEQAASGGNYAVGFDLRLAENALYHRANTQYTKTHAATWAAQTQATDTAAVRAVGPLHSVLSLLRGWVQGQVGRVQN